ncbi:dihydroneopterin aldolase [Proteiniclasticum sp. QWL-01]|uniref:dihydroneopterin aldolase n=1 Tax=Proteiniclasticum sp. QWL-01 TaxID=3036945 RepID=UPI00220920DB|nr:dihydroneopterin aldolase [Proteiniclasticum sp. QWL-01]UUM11137.1 dihydroneopterin aldolase [Clostridiaceae bacterium HFYG-1003]WFF72477.1 dihydroneopterin aldolase [Proteiniclasticum sp. QWL-01]
MDKILLENMHFYGYHGVLAEEKVLGQKFFVDAQLLLDLRQAGRTDDVNDTVSYAQVYRLIDAIVTGERFDLLEALAHRICGQILAAFDKVEEVHLTVKKPGAPVNGHYDYFAVTVVRRRADYD